MLLFDLLTLFFIVIAIIMIIVLPFAMLHYWKQDKQYKETMQLIAESNQLQKEIAKEAKQRWYELQVSFDDEEKLTSN